MPRTEINKQKMHDDYESLEFCTGEEKQAEIKTIEELNFSDDELLRMWYFYNHVKRLKKFTEPGMNNLRSSISELRMSAIINELRPFMLNDDPINFCGIRNIVSRRFMDGDICRKQLRKYKDLWNKYTIEGNNKMAAKMGNSYCVDSTRISTYAELLRIFIYGKYIHNDSDPKNTAIAYRIESGVLYKNVRAELCAGIAHICDILYGFNEKYIEPIISIYSGTIRLLNWNNINIATDNKNSQKRLSR